jgi:hypothetical protein
MFDAIRNGLLIVLLVVGAYFAANFGGSVKNQVFMMIGWVEQDVKGASTQRAEEISGSIGADLGKHIEDAKNNVLNFRVVDVITTISRAERIPQDFQNIGEYIKEQVDNVLQSREQKSMKEKEK